MVTRSSVEQRSHPGALGVAHGSRIAGRRPRGSRPEARLPELVAELDRRAAEQHAPAVQGVTLASLHAAKGLEWDTVFLVGASDGLIPISLAEGVEALEEERRLYVGLTRARQQLFLSWSSTRTSGGRPTRRVSRFLGPAEDILGSGARTAAPTTARRRAAAKVATVLHCRGCGAELTTAAQRKTGRCDDCPPSYDEALFERLREWRLGVARAASVPAFVVFTDATLTAIAEREPADEGRWQRSAGWGPQAGPVRRRHHRHPPRCRSARAARNPLRHRGIGRFVTAAREIVAKSSINELSRHRGPRNLDASSPVAQVAGWDSRAQ